MAPSRASLLLLEVVGSAWRVVETGLAYLAAYGWRVALVTFFGARYARRVLSEAEAKERARLRREAVDPSRVSALDDRRVSALDNIQRQNEAAIVEEQARLLAERRAFVEKAQQDRLKGGTRLGSGSNDS
jgi:hypothetical protein